jgi:HEPN domain-containing protein
LPDETSLSISEEEQERLSDYAVVVRYPVELEPITEEDAKEALGVAKRVRETVHNLLP